MDWSEEKGSKWGKSESQWRPCSVGVAGSGSGSCVQQGAAHCLVLTKGCSPRQGHEPGVWRHGGTEAVSSPPPRPGRLPSPGTGGAGRGSTKAVTLCERDRGRGHPVSLKCPLLNAGEFSNRDD